jgi:uncharacterized membrane protein
MTTSVTEPPKQAAPVHADYESTPITRAEYIAAVVHMYRGELYRANSWRMRLDTTTNWAILTTAGLLTFSFGPGTHTHWVMLLGMPLIMVFHAIEARRYRFADVWRGRVRMIEENFYGPILRRDPVSPERNWGKLVAEDLLRPRLKMSRLEALRNRFTRNYWAIYAALVGFWIAQIYIRPAPAHSFDELRERLTTGMLPWWIPLAWISTFLLSLLTLVILTPKPPSSEAEYWSLTQDDDHDEYQIDL